MPQQTGLTQKQAQRLLEQNGPNELQGKKGENLAALFFSQFKDVMILILAAATLISLFMGQTAEAAAILLIVLLNALLGFLQEMRTEKTLQALEQLGAPTAWAMRDGQWLQLPARELVEGDWIRLSAGDRIPADCRLEQAVGLSSDESMLTGESLPVHKQPGQPLYMGCTVSQGHGHARVTATGMDTEMGRIAGLVEEAEEPPTPLQQRLKQLGKVVAWGCVIICLAVGFLGWLQGGDLLEMLLTGVSLAVAAIPEGLPAIVTIVLALSMGRILRRGAVIRRLHAVETLGCAAVICSDKTGTITENRMTVTAVWAQGGQLPLDKKSSGAECRLWQAAALCSEGEEGACSPTEAALLQAARTRLGTRMPGKEVRRLDETPFDSVRKRMSVVVQQEGKKILYCKGAPDLLLERCASWMTEKGPAPLDAAAKGRARAALEQMAGQGLRVIAVAEGRPETGEQQLCLLGFAGLMDPPRPQVAPAVQTCRRAGIRPVMITGDHRDTAVAVAVQVGIWRPGDKVLTGAELDHMSQQQLTACCMQTSVYARVTPAHKLRIVKAYQAAGRITAMTGDGVNDAPALRQADIGVAMGKSGTDVTRQAAGVVILDDNFATIVAAVEEGRVIYQNIRRFIRYLLTSNLGEVLGMLFVLLAGLPVSLLPIQILLVNLFTDGLPAIALGMEPAGRDLMSSPPRPREEGLFAHGLTRTILLRGTLLGLASSLVYGGALWLGCDLAVARSACFLTIVFSQMVHLFECRDSGLLANPLLLGAAGCSLAAAAASVYLPALQTVCGTASVTGQPLLLTAAGVVGGPLLAALARCIFRLGRRKEKNWQSVQG